jgi:hypothetical protein
MSIESHCRTIFMATGETTKESVMYNGLLTLKDNKGVHIIENAISFIGHRVTPISPVSPRKTLFEFAWLCKTGASTQPCFQRVCALSVDTLRN